MVCKEETKVTMNKMKIITLLFGALFLTMCVPPEGGNQNL